MSSWLVRSIANSLTLDEETAPSISEQDVNPYKTDDYDSDKGEERGVKDDLSELKDSLTQQFWGVASFLAPPPPPPPLPPPPFSFPSVKEPVYAETETERCVNDDDEEEEEPGFGDYYYSDCDEEEEELEEEEAVGITEEVLAFAMNIAHHPETWLDFPLLEEEEFDDFDICDSQYKHVLAVEHLSPRLAALRHELCPAHMTDGYFWMVYFVLLHPRLNKHDADLLSSPQLLQARAKWMQELQKNTKEDPHWLSTSILQAKRSAESSPRDNITTHSNEDAHFGHISEKISSLETTVHHITDHPETVKHPYEVEYVDKSVIKEDPLPKLEEKEMIVGPSTPKLNLYYYNEDEDDDDDWLKEDEDLVGLSGTSIMVNEEDISFSDLEDDIDYNLPVKTKTAL